MLCVRHLVPALLLGVAATCAAESAPAAQQPWTETFTMTLQDKARHFVVHDGTSWMVMDPADLKDPEFLAGKDVMLAGKFERTDSQHAWFFGMDKFQAAGRLEHWATRLEGDNLYVFGRITAANATRTILSVNAVAAAESDAQIITTKLNAIKLDDYTGRLAVAKWVRDQAATQGNRDYWTSAADTIIAQTVDAAAADAATRKDADLVAKAVGWAIDLSHDAGLAARAASQPWLTEAGGPVAEQIAKRLRQQGYLWYKDRWHTKTEALTLEFEARFTAIPWKDAESFFKLGRWAESHADDLPAARDLSYRCYQAGYRGDSNHNGIRRKLGLEAVGGGSGDSSGAGSQDTTFQHGPTGTVVVGPNGWKRAATPLEGDATWLDPGSETACVSVRALSKNETGADFEELWTKTINNLKARQNFTELAVSETGFAHGQARSQRFSYQEGRYTRTGEVCLARENSGRAAVVLTAAFTDTEQANVSAALMQVLGQVAMPENTRPGNAAPGPDNGQPPENTPIPPPGN